MIEFHLPSLGSDMDEGKLLQWMVAPGQVVNKGDVIAVVDTSKAAVDVEVWTPGTVHRLLTEIGQTIPVGTVMAQLLAPGEAASSVPVVEASVLPIAAPGPAAGPAPAAIEAGAAAVMPAPPGQRSAVSPAVSPVVPPAGRLRISPAARRRAQELGVDLARVAPSGPDGAVTLDDVENAARQRAPAAAPATAPAVAPGLPAPGAQPPTPAAAPTPSPTPAPSPTPTPTPADRAAEMRKAIAAAMARSKREIPHYYLAETVPMRALLDWLTVANAGRPVTSRLLPAVLMLKAVAMALRDFPEMNGHRIDGTFRTIEQAHLGVAISLRQGGLVAPALHDVGTRPLDELMRGLADLVKRARIGSLRSSEMSDPTITVTNLGDQGVESVFGVIYPPQVALVGFGRIVDRPWVVDGRLEVMPVVTASLSADHRVSDGHRGALFLARLRDWLQRPDEL